MPKKCNNKKNKNTSFQMNKSNKLILCILFPLLVGSVSGIATASGVNNWFQTINKPSFNPPNYLFGPVWTILYILMGISFYLVLQTPYSKSNKYALAIFFVQLFLNSSWSFLFFRYKLIGVAFIDIILLWLSIICMIYAFSKINKRAAYLQLPYLLWVSFASILNGAIWWLN
jgi:tryptophan-rich sensory protein